MQMERIDELLERATPNFGRRDRLRSLFNEWERVKNSSVSQERIHIPLVVREEPETDGAALVIAAVDSEELQQIRDELEEAGVPVTVEATLPRDGN
jgi:hypothetical protein